MKLSIITAEAEIFCPRCQSLAIPTPTIFKGDKCVLIETGAEQSFCCTDCFQRLQEEVEEIGEQLS